MILAPGVTVTPTIRLQRRLGAGGMGSVWIADHLALRTQVVVKFMAPELVASGDAVERFSREAGAAAQVKSPHVVQMLDHGITPTGVPFIVMELLEGRDLAHHLADRGGRLPLTEIAEIVVQVAKALSRAHERGIVHRDIKPENIFLCDVGGQELFVKLLDFGIAKSDSSGALSGGTKTGATLGTPYYMSPEQMVGARSIDSRSDLWSLGVVVYQCVLGVRPFDAETFGALAVMIHTGTLPTPSMADPSVPQAFDAWFFRACARDPAARFANARDLADALTAVASAQPWTPVVHPPVATQAVAADPFSGSGGGSGTQHALPHVSTHAGLRMGSGAQPAPARGAGVALGVGGALLVAALAGGGWFASRAYQSSHATALATPPTTGAALIPPVAPPPAASVVALPPVASLATADSPPASSSATLAAASSTPAPAIRGAAAAPLAVPARKPAASPPTTPTAAKKDERDIF